MLVLSEGWQITTSNVEHLPSDRRWLHKPGTAAETADQYGPTLLSAFHRIMRASLRIDVGLNYRVVLCVHELCSGDDDTTIECDSAAAALEAAQRISADFWSNEELFPLAEIVPA